MPALVHAVAVSHWVVVWVGFSSALVGAFVGVALHKRRARRRTGGLADERVTRLDAHLSAEPHVAQPTTASSMLRPEVEQALEESEASRDLDVLDSILRDIRDLTGADETIFWRWVEAREALVPSAWSTENASRPAFFDTRAWAPLVRWSAEERMVQCGGGLGGAPVLAAGPVADDARLYGALTISARNGLGFDRESARAWVPRFTSQLVAMLQLIDGRRTYAHDMRKSMALLAAARRLSEEGSAESVNRSICATARDVTSAATAVLVRWNAAQEQGSVQFSLGEPGAALGTTVVRDSLTGRACAARLPVVLEDARAATSADTTFSGGPRRVGSIAIVPILSGTDTIGALVVEGALPGHVTQADARNIGLLAAIARGLLEIAWESDEVSRRAQTDSLTGLANRRHFDEQLKRVIAETDRFGGNCSLIVIDLDHFKQVNDRHGHEAGDAVLRHAAQLFSDAVRTVDLCARYGGEEIAILLPQTALDGAVELAGRLRALLVARPTVHASVELPVTASFGVSSYPVPVPSGEWLFPAADKALYDAKASGRNCVKPVSASTSAAEPYRVR